MNHSHLKKRPGFRRKCRFSNRRHWEKLENVTTNLDSGDVVNNSMNIVILTYNILSQALLEQHAYLYKMCPKKALTWKYRLELILKEVRFIKPDIICFQEVQFSHLEEIKRRLKTLEFETVYKQRTGDKPDGCAICYRTPVFNLTEFNSVEFLQPKEELLRFDNIGLMVKLASKKCAVASLVVCTTHLLFNRRRTDARLAQLQVLLAELDKFSFSEKNQIGTHHLPILLTGDFNSAPQSPVTRLITTGAISNEQYLQPLKNIAVTDTCQHLDVYLERNLKSPKRKHSLLEHSEKKNVELYQKERGYFVNEYKYLFTKNHIKHNFVFKSVYDHLKSNGKMEATVFQNLWTVADYIYYSSNNVTGKLNLQERYSLPTVDECSKIKALPNFQYGSDHFSLAAKFLLSYKT